MKSIIYSLIARFVIRLQFKKIIQSDDQFRNCKKHLRRKTSKKNGRALAAHVAEKCTNGLKQRLPVGRNIYRSEEITKKFSAVLKEWIDYKFTPEDLCGQ